MKLPITLSAYPRLWLAGILSIALVSTIQAQDPTDFFSYKAEQEFRDSLYKQNLDVSPGEVLQAIKAYHQKQGDAYYQAYQKQIAQQKPDIDPLKSQNLSRGTTLNSTTSSEGQVPDAVEYAALEALYNSTGGNNWTYKGNWLQGTTSSDFANWYGITVRNGDVSQISLSSNNLIGSLPSKIEDLTMLSGIFIFSNRINSLPPEIGNLPNLASLTLWDCQLSSIPSEIADLPNLAYLNLQQNQLSSLPPRSTAYQTLPF